MSRSHRRSRSIRRRRSAIYHKAVTVPLHVHADEDIAGAGVGEVIGIEPYIWWGREADFSHKLLIEYQVEPNPTMERIEIEARVRIGVH